MLQWKYVNCRQYCILMFDDKQTNRQHAFKKYYLAFEKVLNKASKNSKKNSLR